MVFVRVIVGPDLTVTSTVLSKFLMKRNDSEKYYLSETQTLQNVIHYVIILILASVERQT